MMSRKKKILIIFHLCFTLSYLFWLLVQPYAKEVVAKKSQVALYEMILERKALFNELPPEEQVALTTGYSALQLQERPSLFHQMGSLIWLETPPFALCWLFFSLLICLLALFRIEGALQAAWLLPMIVAGYAYFLYAHPKELKETFFPAEAYVWENYLSSNEQQELNRREGLLQGWHRYLVVEWAHETPSNEKAVFDSQLDKGLFYFNVARLKMILKGGGDDIVLAGFSASPSALRVLTYFLWNLIFAWLINRKITASEVPLNQSCST